MSSESTSQTQEDQRAKGELTSAILEINPDALVIADELDAERKAGKIRGPLHGIPFVVKVRLSPLTP